MSRIEVKYSLEKCSMGKRLKIIELEKYNSAEELHIETVKNGFSDPPKGRDRQRKDIEDDHQGKALKEGCHERRWAQTSVSSREKINTNKNLARVTTKSKSETRQSLMDVSVDE